MADTFVNANNSHQNGAAEAKDAKKFHNFNTGNGHHNVDPEAALADLRHEFGEHGGVNMSIERSASYTVMEPDHLRQMFVGELGPHTDSYLYSRHFNPTVLNLGRKLAALEGTEAAYCTASGMAAIACALLQLLNCGGHLVASSVLFSGTHYLITQFLARTCNITATLVDMSDLEAVENAIVEGKTKVLYFESMGNPCLKVANTPELARIGHKKGVTVVVDNTFAPMMISPARLGADIVIHSLTKYINGGGDIIAGAVCGSKSFVNSLMDFQQGGVMLLGPTMDPKIAFEISERIPHLGIRMKEHGRRALEYATRLKALGIKVHYPGLEDHPQHELLKSIYNKEYGFGGVLCIDVESAENADELMNYLQNYSQFGFMALSLGYYETLISCYGNSARNGVNEEQQKRDGITPGLVRISVGYVGTLDQKWNQLEKAIVKFNVENEKKEK